MRWLLLTSELFQVLLPETYTRVEWGTLHLHYLRTYQGDCRIKKQRWGGRKACAFYEIPWKFFLLYMDCDVIWRLFLTFHWGGLTRFKSSQLCHCGVAVVDQLRVPEPKARPACPDWSFQKVKHLELSTPIGYSPAPLAVDGEPLASLAVDG